MPPAFGLSNVGVVQDVRAKTKGNTVEVLAEDTNDSVNVNAIHDGRAY